MYICFERYSASSHLFLLMIFTITWIISDIYFIGGFGTVAWVNVKEYEATQPDKIAADGGEQNLKVTL